MELYNKTLPRQHNYPITGTFIDEVTYDMPASNWSNEEWKQELDYMKEVGIDTVILIRGGFYNKMLYPSRYFPHMKTDDFAGLIMEEAAKRNMDVFMGMYISNLEWNGGDAVGEIEKNKIFLQEVCERYGDIPSFKGWYIPHETGEDIFNVADVMAGLSAMCKDKTPEKQVFISPFFKETFMDVTKPMGPKEFYEEWDRIFSKCAKDIDICAYQDGIVDVFKLASYLEQAQKLSKKYDFHLWTNTETFERDVRNMLYPIPFDLLRKKLEVSMPYVEKSITFEFSHFLSPQSIFPSARNLNRLYRDYYENEGNR